MKKRNKQNASICQSSFWTRGSKLFPETSAEMIDSSKNRNCWLSEQSSHVIEKCSKVLNPAVNFETTEKFVSCYGNSYWKIPMMRLL